MSIRRWWCAVALLLAACTTAPPPDASSARQAFAPSGRAQRVVLVSFDGLGADALAAQTGLPSFEWLSRNGTSARVITVNPTQTSPAHATILTGADPQRHGIVANRFHVPGTPFTQTAQGFDTELSVETLLEAARRQGKRVGSIAFPTIDGRSPRRTADFGLFWSAPLSRPETLTLTRRNFRGEWIPPTWTPRHTRYLSYSPLLRARVPCGAALRPAPDVQLIVYDTTDDGEENYDSLTVEADGKEIPVDAEGWFTLTRRDGEDRQASWSKIVHVEPALERVEIYCGSFARTAAYPASFLAIVEQEAGLYPGEPDARAGARIFREQLERFADFFTRVQVAAIRGMQFDLLLAYQPAIDTTTHHFLVTRSSQKTFTPEASAEGDAMRRAAFELADRAVSSSSSALDLTRDALVVVGDHGLSPVDATVKVNRLLADNDLLPGWLAFASGNVANVYRTGERAAPAPEVVAAMQKSGFFELVKTRDQTSHPHAGDVTAIAFPSLTLSPSSDAPVVDRPMENGSHGALNAHRELHTVFFAVGAGTRSDAHADVSQTKIARYVSTLLGIEPPSAAQ